MAVKKKALRIESFNSYKRLTEPVYVVPQSVQETIPISKIAKDGIFEIENKKGGMKRIYDKAYVFWDANYNLKDDLQREEFLKLYCKTLNAMNVSFKILTLNLNRDMKELDETMYLKHTEGEHEDATVLIDDFNANIRARVEEGCAGVEQIKMFIVSCTRQDYENAKAFFRTVEAGLKANFKRMESGLISLNATERLRMLHRIYRLGHEEQFDFDWDMATILKRDWRSDICNLSLREHKDHLEFEDHVARVVFARSMPNSLADEFFTELTAVTFNSINVIDVAPIPKEVAQKKLTDMYNANGRAIEKQQAQRNKAGAYSSEISYSKQQERDEIKGYMDIMRTGDENMFFVGIYVLIIAKDMEELDSNTLTVESIGNSHNLRFESHSYNQLSAFNTCLPVASRQVSTMRTMFTQPLAGLMPFNVQELCDKGGVFYGSNQISKNTLFGDRKKLANGNGFILGVSGSGKSVVAKTELTQVCINTADDIIVIDPQNEYGPLCALLKGQYIDISASTNNYINPLDADTADLVEDVKDFIANKSELVLSICEQILEYGMSAAHKSIIDRCMRKLYDMFFAEGKKKSKSKKRISPTMKDLYMILKEVDEPEVRDLLLALEMFVEGSLNIFAHQTNVNVKNRVTMYGMADLGKALAPVGMLVMLEGIRTRIAANAKKGIATWLFIDEFHNLTTGSSADFLDKRWKEVRKQGGLCTGITQNIVDLLVSKTVETMLANSEFICLLRQSETDREAIERVLRLNENVLSYVQNADKGCGVLKFSGKIIPFDNKLKKTGLLYKVVNTNFHEIQAKKRKALVKEIADLPQEKLKQMEAQGEDTTIPEEKKMSYESIS